MTTDAIRDRELELLRASGVDVVNRSVVRHQGRTFFLAAVEDGGRVLGVRGEGGSLVGTRHEPTGALLCPVTARNAAALRAELPWLEPRPLGLTTSAGFGDRLGLATPGHVRALRAVDPSETAVVPIFAQQSVRENARTGRTPQQVLDDAMWGLFGEGWRSPWGADADHLKTVGDVEAFARAGYTFYTIDPGDAVNDRAAELSGAELEAAVRALPWGALEDSLGDLENRYLGTSFDLGAGSLNVERTALWCAAAKYGAAVAHTTAMFRHILERVGEGAFELEVSVDETASPTSLVEHLYIARELKRLGVRWVSLAPRFVGAFEKGVDYIGDLAALTADLAGHAEIARSLGPYKLSLHSGSDKFHVYPIAARCAASPEGPPLVHVKTAGTSYLEALRAIATTQPQLFRDILELARARYETDRATYHVSARLERVPAAPDLSDHELADLLEQFDARQVLHVTFGSVLAELGDPLRAALTAHAEIYADVLQRHFERHLAPFVTQGSGLDRASATPEGD